MKYLNFELLLNDLRKIPFLIFSLIILSIGISILRVAGFGLDAWGTFHEGISLSLTINFGVVSLFVGILILLLSLPLKIYPGIGTIANIFLVGPSIDFFTPIIESFEVNTIFLLLLGYFITNIGRALYISSGLGAGPRDAVYVGISYLSKKSVVVIKPLIEFIVLAAGLFLGATIGIGIIIMILFSGVLINAAFKILGYDTKNSKPSTFNSYLNLSNSISIREH
jgi:uncharacterized membrane protein YczE